MKAENKLRLRWNKKESDIEVLYPLGLGTKCDVGLLFHAFCHQKFPGESTLIEELIARVMI